MGKPKEKLYSEVLTLLLNRFKYATMPTGYVPEKKKQNRVDFPLFQLSLDEYTVMTIFYLTICVLFQTTVEI